MDSAPFLVRITSKKVFSVNFDGTLQSMFDENHPPQEIHEEISGFCLGGNDESIFIAKRLVFVDGKYDSYEEPEDLAINCIHKIIRAEDGKLIEISDIPREKSGLVRPPKSASMQS